MADKPKSRKRSDFDYPAYFREMRLLHDLTVLPGEASWRGVPPTEPEPHRVVLYLGCNVLRNSHMIRTITDIMDLLGEDYVAVGGPAYCCGIMHHRTGDVEIAQSMGRNAVRYFERFEPERVVMWCPSCIHYYDEIFQVPSSFQTQHVTEYLAERLDDLTFVRSTPQRVALHHHCNRPQRIAEAEAAKKLLSAVPGLDYVGIDSNIDLGRACSHISQQALGVEPWRQAIAKELRQAEESGAGVFATLYHGCQRLICAFEDESSLTIDHYLSVFGRALGIDHEDKYKKYRLWADPDRVLAEMTPCMVANDVDEQEARQVVARAFPSG